LKEEKGLIGLEIDITGWCIKDFRNFLEKIKGVPIHHLTLSGVFSGSEQTLADFMEELYQVELIHINLSSPVEKKGDKTLPQIADQLSYRNNLMRQLNIKPGPDAWEQTIKSWSQISHSITAFDYLTATDKNWKAYTTFCSDPKTNESFFRRINFFGKSRFQTVLDNALRLTYLTANEQKEEKENKEDVVSKLIQSLHHENLSAGKESETDLLLERFKNTKKIDDFKNLASSLKQNSVVRDKRNLRIALEGIESAIEAKSISCGSEHYLMKRKYK